MLFNRVVEKSFGQWCLRLVTSVGRFKRGWQQTRQGSTPAGAFSGALLRDDNGGPRWREVWRCRLVRPWDHAGDIFQWRLSLVVGWKTAIGFKFQNTMLMVQKQRRPHTYVWLLKSSCSCNSLVDVPWLSIANDFRTLNNITTSFLSSHNDIQWPTDTKRYLNV
jgi:hypothetical protein